MFLFLRTSIFSFAVAGVALFFVMMKTPANAAEFTDEVERDFAIRTIGQLNVTNLRGAISVQGWSLDKIRVKAKRKVSAETKEEAAKFFRALDFRYETVGKDIELSAEYGRGLNIDERLKERQSAKSDMQIIVYAPSNLNLRIWTVDGAASVKSWNANVEIRTAKGPISAEQIKAQNVSVMCPSCQLKAKAIKASFRCMGGSGAIELNDLRGTNIYVETDSGNIDVSRVKGEQLYVLKSAALTAKGLDGRIEFHSQSGSIQITESSGFLSGRTETGNISAKMNEWRFLDKALMESREGSIALNLPSDFSGEVDVWSFYGKTAIGFPVEKLSNQRSIGPEPINRIQGVVGRGGEVLKLFSEKGDVSLVKIGKN